MDSRQDVVERLDGYAAWCRKHHGGEPCYVGEQEATLCDDAVKEIRDLVETLKVARVLIPDHAQASHAVLAVAARIDAALERHGKGANNA